MLVVRIVLVLFKRCLHLVIQERVCMRIRKRGVSDGHGGRGQGLLTRSTAVFVILHHINFYSGLIRMHLIVLHLHRLGLPRPTSRATPAECYSRTQQDGHDVGGHRTKDVSQPLTAPNAPPPARPLEGKDHTGKNTSAWKKGSIGRHQVWATTHLVMCDKDQRDLPP